MKLLLDTCVLSELQRPQPNLKVRDRVEQIAPENFHLSAVTIGELIKGIEKLAQGKRRQALEQWLALLIETARNRILPIDLDTARIWGEITAKAAANGRTVPPIDGLIAATAVQHDLELMTRNVSDFKSTGVKLINPWE